jgi:hypothetical protein
MNNVNMGGMNMGGPVAGMPVMNNGNPGQQRVPPSDPRAQLNTYIYEYFLKNEMYECARAIVKSEQPLNLDKEGMRRDENGNILGNGINDSMDTDIKEDSDSKRPDDLPAPVIGGAVSNSDACFLYDWWCLFWDIFAARSGKSHERASVKPYIQHTMVIPTTLPYLFEDPILT